MPDIRKLRTPSGDWVGPNELQDLLVDEGYSATERKQFLNAALTELAAESSHGNGRGRLLKEVRAILEREQAKHDSSPVAEDNL